jgi:hypothetical protein
MEKLERIADEEMIKKLKLNIINEIKCGGPKFGNKKNLLRKITCKRRHKIH